MDGSGAAELSPRGPAQDVDIRLRPSAERARFGESSGAATDRLAMRGVVDQGEDLRRQVADVAEPEEHTGVAVGDDFTRAGNVARKHRATARLGLEADQR